MISFVVTTYRTGKTLKKFFSAFDSLNEKNYEIILVDNMSDDETVSVLEEIKVKFGDKLKIIREKCNRGEGRQIGLINSNGEFIFQLDADLYYRGLNSLVEKILSMNTEKLIRILGKEPSFNMTCGSRKTWQFLEGYPPLNYLEDLYVWRLAEMLNMFEEIKITGDEIEQIDMGIEKKEQHSELRYSKNKKELWNRRIDNASHILFSSGYGFRLYRKIFFEPKFSVLPYSLYLYIRGTLRKRHIKYETVEQRYERLKNLFTDKQ
ncbi:glycosyltransferase family 2 protein [Caldiplasma sukawensis]